MYLVKDFNSSSRISVIARGESARHIHKVNDFEDCFLVGQFTNALADCSMVTSLSSKKIVQIVNKSSIKTDKATCNRYGIRDLQCSFAPNINGGLSSGKTKVYKKIVKANKHLKVHLGPCGIKERQAKPPKSWATTGLYAIDLAAFFGPKEIWIFGVDFYESGYLCNERVNVSIESNRKRKKSMITNLYGIVNRDSDIKFTIFTHCKSLISQNNLEIILI